MSNPTNDHPYTFDGDRGPYINTWSGISFHILDPIPEEVFIEDIAHHLSHQSRSVGAVDVEYCVAQHCLLVLDIVSRKLKNAVFATDEELRIIKLKALLHDSEEYVTGDVPKPLKMVLDPILKPIAKRIKKAIGIKLNCDLMDMPHIIKHADNIAMATERVQRYKPSDVIWHKLPNPDSKVIPPMTAKQAEKAFLRAYHQLASVV